MKGYRRGSEQQQPRQPPDCSSDFVPRSRKLPARQSVARSAHLRVTTRKYLLFLLRRTVSFTSAITWTGPPSASPPSCFGEAQNSRTPALRRRFLRGRSGVLNTISGTVTREPLDVATLYRATSPHYPQYYLIQTTNRKGRSRQR